MNRKAVSLDATQMIACGNNPTGVIPSVKLYAPMSDVIVISLYIVYEVQIRQKNRNH